MAAGGGLSFTKGTYPEASKGLTEVLDEFKIS
jgi:hypothetical protein